MNATTGKAIDASYDGRYQIIPEGCDCIVVTIRRGLIVGLKENQEMQDLPELTSQDSEQITIALDEFYGFRHERSMLVISRIS